MQRLARVGLEQYAWEAIELFHHYDDIVAVLNRYLPPSTTNILARPEVKDNMVEWYSELQGQPQLLNAHSSHYAEANALVVQRLASIDALVSELLQKEAIEPAIAAYLKQFTHIVKQYDIQIYSVNQQPVITGWGLKDITAEQTPPVTEAKTPRRWLLPLLLFTLAILGFLVWLFLTPSVPETVKIEPIVPKNCRKVEKPADIPQLAIIFNNATGMKYTLLESKEAINAFDEKLQQQILPQSEIDYMDRQPNRSVAAKEAVTHLINDIPNAVDIGLVELQSCVSKSPDVSAAISHGIFTGAQRTELKNKVQNMTVRDHRVPGTPIYEGIEKALTLLDGKKREALIVLITEGNGDCTERKICTLMENVAKERPKLKVNIVSINSPWNVTDCLAKSTGGQIFDHDMTSQEKLTDAIKQAMKPVQQEICE
ncbi:hypothetical protein [Aggregatibacter aphrophilus]|uniref:VWFA domain-containing protein n=1 Tax=Aggregatibacter aphrophilus TaxID=732 RepID=A0AAP7GX48_AGGAP|nr:hypothetical protein [Aggregatibacter aphrophilus]OBY52862.1 hypothetical protein BBB52_05890 [Aggregatibacter aphrophilus]